MNHMLFNTLIWLALFSAVGWVALAKGLRRRRALLEREERERGRATGTIVGYAEAKKGGAKRPVVEFTAEGSAHRLECAAGTNPAALPVGAEVEVRYDPDDPERFHLESEETAPRGGRALLVFGVTWILICAMLATGAATLRGRTGARLRFALRGLNAFDITGIFYKEADDAKVTGRDGEFEYVEKSDLLAVVTGYTGSDSSLTVPLVVGGHVVSGLSMMAFARCDSLVSATVPGHIPAIPAACFNACVSLREVVLEDGVQAIEAHAFGICPSLKRVVLPASLERIDDTAFPDDCKACFEVIEGSAAERYCREKGFEVKAGPAQ